MEYDKKLLETWANMECWGDYIKRKGALGDFVSNEQFETIEKEYFGILKRRIQYCKRILERYQDAFLYYALARLFDKYNVDESPEYLFKRHTRFYCIRAIKQNCKFAPPWALLAESYSWVAFLGGDSNITPEMEVSFNEDDVVVGIFRGDFLVKVGTQNLAVRYIEKAINCIKRAYLLEPQNENYSRMLKEYFHQRNEEYLW